MNLLIVDDEWYAVKGLSEGIDWSDIGIDLVLEAFDAREAMEKAEANDVDVVICDIEMPGLSGIDFAQWMGEHFPYAQTIFLTGHADFSYAQKALQYKVFEYILKPVDHAYLKSVVKKALEAACASEQKDLFLTKWGEYAARWEAQRGEMVRLFWRDAIDRRLTDSQLKAGLSLYGIPLAEHGWVTPFALWIDDYGAIDTMRDVELAGFILQEKAEKKLHGQCEMCAIRDSDVDTLGLLYDGGDGVNLAQLAAEIGGEMGCTVAWMRGEASAPEALWWSIHCLKQEIRETRDKPMADTTIDWETLLLSRPAEPIHQQIDKLLDSISTRDKLWARAFCLKLKGAAWAVLLGQNASLSGLQTLDVPEQQLDDPQRLRQWAHSVADCCVSTLQQNHGSRSRPIASACQYIHGHLNQELSREEIASKVFLHPAYLSRLFRREMGVTLSEYITQERIRAARKLLCEPGIKVGAVATQVGYTQFSHFSRVFRKVVGLSPQQFQQQYKTYET